jgi:Icc protein
MLIAHISDSHITLNGPQREDRLRDLERCVAHVNALDPAPDLVIHGGDIAQDGLAEEYALARDILDRLNAPLTVLPGNRDDRAALADAFGDCVAPEPDVPFIQYARDLGDLVLVVLDTLDAGNRKGALCGARLALLERQLEQADGRPLLLAMHHTPFDVMEASDGYRFQFDSRETVARFSGLVASHPNILRILCGHVHRPAAGEVAGVPASAIPSIAADLRMGFYPEDHAQQALYQLFDFDPVSGENRCVAVAG